MRKRRLATMDVQTLLGRVRSHQSDRGIARALKLSRTTVKKYRTWFEAEGFVTGESMPTLNELHARLRAVFGDSNPPQNQSSIASYRDEIKQWLAEGLRPPLPRFHGARCHVVSGLSSPRSGMRQAGSDRPPSPSLILNSSDAGCKLR